MLAYQIAPLLLAVLAAADQGPCWWKTNNQIRNQPNGWFVCNGTQTSSGGASLCCINGSECGEDSICRREGTGDDSRWYIGGCTDGSYDDPICRHQCSGDKMKYIHYNTSNSLWYCCGNDGCEETHPTEERFSAISPSKWHAIGESADDDDDNNSGVSTPVKAGIGVGVAIGVLCIIGAIVACIWWRTKKSRQSHRGIKGKYAQIPIPFRSASPAPRNVYSDPQRSPYNQPSPMPSRGASPGPARERGTSPRPSGRFHEETEDSEELPSLLHPGSGSGPQAPDQISVMSRD